MSLSKDIVRDIKAGKLSLAQEKLNALFSNKARKLIDEKKKEIAKTMFNK
jgi:hypothetical protein